VLAEEDEHAATEARVAEPARPAEPEAGVLPPRGGRRRAADHEPEEDDFSHTSSWLNG
jgi:hypothetical protein